MDSSPPAPSILETLRTVEFRLGLKGYNVDEVDEYLEKAAVEAEGLQEQFRQANERLRQATERISQLEAERGRAGGPGGGRRPPPSSDDTLQHTLLLAQKFVDQTKRESEAEAAELVSQAEEKARTTLAQAEEEARQLTTDAERRPARGGHPARGDAGPAGLRRGEHGPPPRGASGRRLRTALAEVLKWVEENIQPASSLMALRPHDEEKAADAASPRPGRRPSAPGPVRRRGSWR